MFCAIALNKSWIVYLKYPNRNRISRDLFSTLSATIQMSDFTIVRVDFKQYFNSISSIYVFEKYLKNDLSNRYEMDLVKAFVSSTKYAYAGLCTSNAIAEIIAKRTVAKLEGILPLCAQQKI